MKSVRAYNVTTGHLILEHNYRRQNGSGDNAVVEVDVNPLLETMTSEDLRVGTWLNVLGYVRRKEQTPNVREDYIEAVLVFQAGAVALGEYERIVRDAQDVDLARSA